MEAIRKAIYKQLLHGTFCHARGCVEQFGQVVDEELLKSVTNNRSNHPKRSIMLFPTRLCPQQRDQRDSSQKMTVVPSFWILCKLTMKLPWIHDSELCIITNIGKRRCLFFLFWNGKYQLLTKTVSFFQSWSRMCTIGIFEDCLPAVRARALRYPKTGRFIRALFRNPN